MPSILFLIKRFLVLPPIIFILNIVYISEFFFVKALDILIPWKHPRVVRTPEDRFEELDSLGYTFKSNYVELPIGGGKTLPRLHYVDEGPRVTRETLLCLHGEPSWSFLYRHMIHAFVKAGYRVIAPDFIGFGKSDKYTHTDSYTHDLHTLTVRLLLDHLNVRGITLVCQDWGGPVGLTVVKDCPHMFNRLVIMNSGLPLSMEPSTLLHGILYGTPILLWKSIVQLLGRYLPIAYVFKFALKVKNPAALNGYCAPFPSHLYKAGVVQWPALVPDISSTAVTAEMLETREFLAKYWQKEALLMYADGDKITEGWKDHMVKVLPRAVTKTISGAGHFLQEDKGKEVANHIISFIEEKL